MKAARVLAMAAGLTMTANAIAVPTTLRVGDAAVEVETGFDQCLLDEKADEADRIVVTQQRQVNQDLNELLAIFVPCSKLGAFRAGEPLRRYGILLTPYLKGRIQTLPGMSRSEFLKVMNNRWENGASVNEEDARERVTQATPDTRLTESRQLGVLHRDDSALYTGLVTRFAAGGSTYTIAGVMAHTMVNGYVLQYTLYENGDEAAIQSLLRDIQPVMRDLVTRNDRHGAAVGRSYLEEFAGKALGAGATGAVTGAVVATVLVIFAIGVQRLFQRRRSKSPRS